MALSSNLYKFKVQTLENILAQTAAPKEWPSYGNFREVIENPHFLKKCKGGTRGNFFKNRSKSKPRLKGRKALLRKGYYPLIIMHLRAKTGDDFRAKRLWKCPNGQVMAILARSPKTRIFWKSANLKFFKNRPKSILRLKGPKALCPKWHYPPTSMLLRCKDWRRFWRKRRLQKCPNGEVMAIFARSPKTRIFWKRAK